MCLQYVYTCGKIKRLYDENDTTRLHKEKQGSGVTFMNKQRTTIDLAKLAIYILKRIWLLILCAAIGFGVMYYRASKTPDTYTTYGTMFVTNSNPNLVNYGYTSTSDISSAVQLVNIYSEVVKSETVMQRVLEYEIEPVENSDTEQAILLSQKYPGITTEYIRSVISMHSVNETPMVQVSCTTLDPSLSADICNSVLQVAPAAIKDVVSAGEAKAHDYAAVPMFANKRSDLKKGLIGALAGIVAACALLTILFLMNNRVEKPGELTDNYTPPILSYIRRAKGGEKDAGAFLLNEKSDMDLVESYAKLRMNLLYTMTNKTHRTVLVTSAISGEGKSTIAANLAVSLAMSGKKILLVDADMRRACLSDIFYYDPNSSGLADILTSGTNVEQSILSSEWDNLDVLPAGSVPTNPCELLESPTMHNLLQKLQEKYDMVLMDVPPINIVSDPLALSSEVAGTLFVVRQNFSDHREIRRALVAAEMTGLEVLGFVFYGEKLHDSRYYNRRSQRGYQYYNKYDPRIQNGKNNRSTNKDQASHMFKGDRA